MKKWLLTFAVLLLVLTGCTFNDKGSDKPKTDAVAFKEEYEALNGMKNPNNDKIYTTLDIPEDNPIVYASIDEVMDLLDQSTVIYFGFPECPWCRSMMPVLLRAAKDSGIEKIYYLNALSLRDVKTLDEQGNIVTEKEGDPKYYALLEKMGDNVLPYGGLNDESVKRLYFPTVVTVKSGEIILYHTSTVESQEDPYTVLTEEQQQELYDIYAQAFKKLTGACSIDKC